MTVIHSRKRLLESSRFFIERIEYSEAAGPKFERDVVRHPGAVVILPIDQDNNLLFVSQNRVAIGRELIELAAGTLETAEVPFECAKRELAEEVGVAAQSWIEFGEIYPAPGFCDEKLFQFVAKNLSPFKLAADAEENITVVKLSAQQVWDSIKQGQIQDAKTLALLFRAHVAGLW